jgi:hypothetical protein
MGIVGVTVLINCACRESTDLLRPHPKLLFLCSRFGLIVSLLSRLGRKKRITPAFNLVAALAFAGFLLFVTWFGLP